MGKIIFSIRVPAFFVSLGERSAGALPAGRRAESRRAWLLPAWGYGQGAAPPAFLPARRGSVFQQDFKCPISFINSFGAMVFKTSL